ncbi:putative holin-like toxin [Schinkia azotoformans]|nr:putative holin-like toxin [Schinkia azotoformans]MEC1636979.1 putative holin-like toxin [Schinkia azotoformans]MEC1722201.1 putative holin-like toxin [Schinkia azotoformans]MEC1947055.1 putative holin-like toxin [Schinkia azotoformans]MED4412437.1 putative holin-like toxin [Schinkia azotoformans]
MVSFEAANLALSFGAFTLTLISVIIALMTLNKKK